MSRFLLAFFLTKCRNSLLSGLYWPWLVYWTNRPRCNLENCRSISCKNRKSCGRERVLSFKTLKNEPFFADFPLLVFIAATVAAGWLLGKARTARAEGKAGGWAAVWRQGVGGQLGKWNLNFWGNIHQVMTAPCWHVSLWLAPRQPLR